MRYDKKPYQARVLLKSISFWQSVVSGQVERKRPMAYYSNKLKYYTAADIEYLKTLSKMKMVKQSKHWIISAEIK